MIGRRRSGKSILTKDILYNLRHIPVGIVISHTEKLLKFFCQFIPKMFIYDRYSKAILEKLLERQSEAVENNWKDPECFVLFDDCFSKDSEISRDEKINEIFFNGRHYKITFLMTMQSPRGLGTGTRSNIDYVFLFKTDNESDREIIFKNYAGVFPNKNIFRKIMDAVTQNYTCLVIDYTTGSNKLEDKIFFYKAEEREFKMFNKKFWTSNDSDKGRDKFDEFAINDNTKKIRL